MNPTKEEKNKALVLEALTPFSTNATTQPLNAIGPPTTFSTALTSNRVARGCSN